MLQYLENQYMESIWGFRFSIFSILRNGICRPNIAQLTYTSRFPDNFRKKTRFPNGELDRNENRNKICRVSMGTYFDDLDLYFKVNG